MKALAITLASVGYGIADLYAARYLYGLMRARVIDNWKYTYTEPVEGFNEDRGLFMIAAFFLATAWPFTLAGFGLYRFMSTTPVKSALELKEERNAAQRRIAELERELGIK